MAVRWPKTRDDCFAAGAFALLIHRRRKSTSSGKVGESLLCTLFDNAEYILYMATFPAAFLILYKFELLFVWQMDFLYHLSIVIHFLKNINTILYINILHYIYINDNDILVFTV